MSNPEEKPNQELTYSVKGIPVSVYLNQKGDFYWTPTKPACQDKEKAKEFLELLQKMPEDRRAVWATRLDAEQTVTTCPIIRQEADLCKEFDGICAAYDKNRHRPKQIGEPQTEVRTPNE
jgi:hypothetical protein